MGSHTPARWRDPLQDALEREARARVEREACERDEATIARLASRVAELEGALSNLLDGDATWFEREKAARRALEARTSD